MGILRNFMLVIGTIALAAGVSSAQDTSTQSQDEVTVPHLSAKDAAASAQDTAPTFTLTLKAGLRNKDISEFRAGSKVWITIVQKNISNHAIDVSGVYSGGVNKEFLYDVVDEDGKPAEKVAEPHPELNAQSPFWRQIPAGESDLTEALLSRIYKFDRPGKYTIQVSRPEPVLKDEAGKPVVEKSNLITITITG